MAASALAITLQAIADLSDGKTVNINVLTHITKARIETLVREGKSFSEAKRQAEGEFQDFLGVTEHFNQGFEQMSIVSQGDFNAMLLAFESYVALFQAAHKESAADYIYPDKATPAPEMGPGGEVPNILVKDVTHFDGTHAYVVAAITPLGKNLTIKVTGDVYLDTSLNNGWVVIEQTNNSFTIEAQRQNTLVSMLVYLGSPFKNGSATIEYFEDSDTPTFTKQITWTGGWMESF